MTIEQIWDKFQIDVYPMYKCNSEGQVARIENPSYTEQQFRADIISLMQSVVPEEKINSAEAGYQSGWNLCRSAILENINRMKGE